MRGRPADLAAAVACAAGGAAGVALEGHGRVAPAVAVLGLALALSRPRPPLAWATALAASLATVALAPHAILATPLVLVTLHCFAAGRWGRTLTHGLAATAALIGASLLGAVSSGDASVPLIMIPGAAWAAGWAVREREIVLQRLAERARELEEEREAHAELSVRYERARIAAELHDIVAHAISVMVVQAGAGQRLAGIDDALTSEAFGAIAEAARQAEQDMGRLVALLSDEEAIGPAPDLALIGELVARASGAGLDVRLRLEGDREGLPPAATQAAYRVVQESLTNAMRYAAGARVEVVVRGGPDGLVLRVVNGPGGRAGELDGHGTGSGLPGLRDRVAAAGGRLDWGRTADGGWSVSASVPRRVAAGYRT